MLAISQPAPPPLATHPYHRVDTSRDLSQPHPSFTPGSLYIAGFAQARRPHAALLLASTNDHSTGHLVHIRLDPLTSTCWTYQSRAQPITGDMFLSTLLKVRDASDGAVTLQQLEAAAAAVPGPQNDMQGECLHWVLRVVQRLQEKWLVDLDDADALGEEFEVFAAGNRAYASRLRFPNVKASQFAS